MGQTALALFPDMDTGSKAPRSKGVRRAAHVYSSVAPTLPLPVSLLPETCSLWPLEKGSGAPSQQFLTSSLTCSFFELDLFSFSGFQLAVLRILSSSPGVCHVGPWSQAEGGRLEVDPRCFSGLCPVLGGLHWLLVQFNCSGHEQTRLSYQQQKPPVRIARFSKENHKTPR